MDDVIGIRMQLSLAELCGVTPEQVAQFELIAVKFHFCIKCVES